MTVVPIDLSAFKPTAGDPLAAAKIANAMTAIETWSGGHIDPQGLLQNGATIGQGLMWNGSLWVPGGDLRYPIAPTFIGPTNGGNTAGALTANAATLMPISIVCPTVVSRLVYGISSGATGTFDIGIYSSDDEATFTRLVAKGSGTLLGGVQNVVSITPTTITPVAGRRWYLAISGSSASPVWIAAASAGTLAVTKGTSHPLPASITGTSSAVTQPFLFGMV